MEQTGKGPGMMHQGTRVSRNTDANQGNEQKGASSHTETSRVHTLQPQSDFGICQYAHLRQESRPRTLSVPEIQCSRIGCERHRATHAGETFNLTFADVTSTLVTDGKIHSHHREVASVLLSACRFLIHCCIILLSPRHGPGH